MSKIKRYIVVYYTPEGLGPILHDEGSLDKAQRWVGYLHTNPKVLKINGKYKEVQNRILPDILEVEFNNFD